MFADGFGLCGLAACFGASTVTGGSGVPEPVAVCDAAGPHSKTVDKRAAAEGATKLDDNLVRADLTDKIGNVWRVAASTKHA